MTGRSVLAIVSIIIFMSMLGASSDSHVGYALPYTDIDVDTAYDMITNSSYPPLVVLDVRTQREYGSGHIYGAVWIPYTELEARIGELAGHEDHEIIVYCRSGGRSVTASGILDSYNFTEVYNMLGGFLAWQSAGYPVWIGTVHNIDTAFSYDTIQAAIDAPQTLNEHTIFVKEGIYCEHLVIDKSLILIGESKETTVVDGSGENRTVIEVYANNVNINCFTVQNSSRKAGTSYAGIKISGHSCNVTGNYVTKTKIGIFVISQRSWITENTIISNGQGIALYASSEVTVEANNVSGNTVGISLALSLNNVIVGNKVTESSAGGHGITLSSNSLNNTIHKNDLRNNGHGIWLSDSTNNLITENTIANNGILGIELSPNSPNNTIYHNNFITNNKHVVATTVTPNTWDAGYPSGGNYWNNYNSADLSGGPNQDQLGGDGIGDEPYIINENNTDHYPLMGLFHSFNASHEKHVNVISNSTIKDFAYFESNHTIRMHVSNMTGNQTFGFCRVCIPNTLMDVSDISVIIDDGVTATLYPNYDIYDNGTHRWIYFAYEHSTHKIDIIPEFPSFLITPLFMIGTLLAFIVHRRKHIMN